jgi:hypothetical protein
MGGQVLGGGVIMLVAVLLWLVYLLPSWQSRRQFDAAERNAVRLNQALRVLAETSETPHEVRLELNTRTAHAQQRIARRALAEREDLARRTQTEREQAGLEVARRELASARALPAARQARARRRARIVVGSLAVLSLGLFSAGIWVLVATGTQLLMWVGVLLGAMSLLLLRRIAVVGARRSPAQEWTADAAPHADAALQDVPLPADPRTWAPRRLPQPLTASAGSRAAAILDATEAQESLRQAAVAEAMRQRAEALRPPSITPARVATARGQLTDDAEIEAHVRELLARRAVGQ